MKITSSKNNFAFSDNEYGYFVMSGDQTTGIALGDPVKFDTRSVGNITYTPASYTITLKKNKTYRLSAMVLSNYSNSSGSTLYRFYDTTNAVYIGNTSYNLPVSCSANNTSITNACAIYTPTTDVEVHLRITSVTNLVTIYYSYSYWEVQQINIVSPVIQDPTRDYAYVSPLLDLTVTSSGGGAGFSVIRAKGYFYKLNNGTWKLNANICTTQTATTTRDVDIAGIVTKNVANFYQGVTIGAPVASSGAISAYFNPNSGTIIARSASNYAINILTLDVELNAKPTGFAIPADV